MRRVSTPRPARVVGVASMFIPMPLTGRHRMARRAAFLAMIPELGEVLGNASYVVGACESIAIAFVLASQFAALAARPSRAERSSGLASAGKPRATAGCVSP